MAARIYSADFEEKVLKNQAPVLVDFYSDSCVACKKLAPTLCEIEEEYEGKLDVFKVNTGFDTDIAKEYGIMSNPTLILFKDGHVLEKVVGAKDYDDLAEWLDAKL